MNCLALVDAFIRLNILYPRVQITDDKKENAQTGWRVGVCSYLSVRASRTQTHYFLDCS